MPNIFICGYEKRAEQLKESIDNLMQGMGLQDDAITSIIELRSESCDGKKTSMPYLWIRSTDKKEIFQIIRIFKKKGIQEDLEWDVVGGFIPGNRMLPDPPLTKKPPNL